MLLRAFSGGPLPHVYLGASLFKEDLVHQNFIRKMPRPCSAGRFSPVRGSGTAFRSNPCPWCLTTMETPLPVYTDNEPEPT